MFTSLSHVGFGDLHPVTNTDRLLTVPILVFGVAVFSYFMGKFVEIISDFKARNEETDDLDTLAKFFGMLQKFNGNRPINLRV